MNPDVLREQLVILHQELGMARHLDPRSVQLLGELMEDIRRLLERSPEAVALPPAEPPLAADAPLPAPPTAPPRAPLRAPDESRSLPDRLEQIAVQFEVDHPTLAASSRRLVDILAKAGL